jgi:hypothetical protein
MARGTCLCRHVARPSLPQVFHAQGGIHGFATLPDNPVGETDL